MAFSVLLGTRNGRDEVALGMHPLPGLDGQDGDRLSTRVQSDRPGCGRYSARFNFGTLSQVSACAVHALDGFVFWQLEELQDRQDMKGRRAGRKPE